METENQPSAPEGFPGARPIPSHPDVWAAPDGRIISTRRRRPRVLSPYPFHNHLRVSIRRNNISEPARVAQLVCEAFHGPRPSPDHLAIHIDGIRTNNAAMNVRWSTVQEKVKNQVDRGTYAHGETHGCHKLTEPQVIEIRELARKGASAKDLAPRFGVRPGTIQFVINGQTWRHVTEGQPAIAA